MTTSTHLQPCMKVCPTHPTPNLGCGPVPPCPPAGPQQVLLGHTLVWMMRDKLALPLVNTVRAGNDTSLSSPLPPPAVSPLSTPNYVTLVNSQLCHPGQLPVVECGQAPKGTLASLSPEEKVGSQLVCVAETDPHSLLLLSDSSKCCSSWM